MVVKPRLLEKTIAVQAGALEEEIDPRALHLRVGENVAYMSLPLRNLGQGMAVIVGVGAIDPAIMHPRS